jgi:hypothetical protein
MFPVFLFWAVLRYACFQLDVFFKPSTRHKTKQPHTPNWTLGDYSAATGVTHIRVHAGLGLGLGVGLSLRELHLRGSLRLRLSLHCGVG